MIQWWRDHSLTIVITGVGTVLIVTSFLVENDRYFDLLMGLGQGVLTTGWVFFLSQFLREKAKPED